MSNKLSQLLQFREHKGVLLPKRYTKAVAHDGLLVLFDESDIVVVDLVKLSSQTIQKSKSNSNGTITTIAISPSKKNLVAGLSNGAIILYDLFTFKPITVLAKASDDLVVLSAAFRDDSNVYVSDSSGKITKYSFSSSVLSKSVKETVVLHCVVAIREIHFPRNSSLESDIFAWTTSEMFVLFDGSSECELLALTGDYPICCFSKSVGDDVNFAVCLDHEVRVYCISKDKQITLLWTAPLDFKSRAVTFLAPSILGICDSTKCVRIVSIVDRIPQLVNTKLQFMCDGANALFFRNGEKLWKGTLMSFANIMSALRSTQEFEKALQVCKQALENHPEAVIGLPSNTVQRSMIIETEIANLLGDHCEKKLREGVDPEAVAEFVVRLSLDMSMTEWVIGKGLEIFKKAGKLPVFFAKVVQGDPKAEFFYYTKNFVREMLAGATSDITEFLLSLPNKVTLQLIPQFLSYAQCTENWKLLANIYAWKLNDLESAANVYSVVGMGASLCEFLLENLCEDLIRWMFSMEEMKFPRIRVILACDNSPLVVRVFDSVYNFVKTNEKPFSCTSYVYGVLHELAVSRPHQGVLDHIAVVIITNHVIVHQKQFETLMPYIFTYDVRHPDRRENLLACLVSQDVPKAFKDAILPLCDSFGFRQVKRIIMIQDHKLAGILSDILTSKAENPFHFIQSILSSGDDITKLIENHIEQLIHYDIDQLLDLLETHFNDMKVSLIERISDLETKLYYIHHLRKRGNFKLDEDYSLSYIKFLCKYYPDSALSFVEDSSVNKTEILPICKEHVVYDVCAYTAREQGNTEDMKYYLSKYFIQICILLADSNDASARSDFKMRFKRLLDLISDEFIEEIVPSLLSNFVLSVFAVQQQAVLRPMKEEVLRMALQEISSRAVNVISYDKFLTLFVEKLGNMELDLCLPAIQAVVQDYSYDVESGDVLVEIFHRDEANSMDSFVLAQGKGVRFDSNCCAFCHKSLVHGNSVRVFKCGHVFHEYQCCSSQQVCPVCNPEKRMDSSIARQPIVNSNNMTRILRKFEYKMSSDPPRSNPIEKKGSISVKKSAYLKL